MMRYSIFKTYLRILLVFVSRQGKAPCGDINVIIVKIHK